MPIVSTSLCFGQKLDAVGIFLLPRFDFIMQGAKIDKGYLAEAYKIVKRLAKSWLGLLQRARAELVYLPSNQGGGGLLPLSDTNALLTVAYADRILHASDTTLGTLAKNLCKRPSPRD